MSCRQLEQAATAGELQPRGLLQLEMWRACREITRTEGGRGAVRAAELGDRFCDSFVQIPPAAAEEPRLEAGGLQPGGLLSHERGRIRAAGGPRVIGSGPVRVQAERPARLRVTRALQPAL